MVLMHAQAGGVPCVTTRHAGNPEVLPPARPAVRRPGARRGRPGFVDGADGPTHRRRPHRPPGRGPGVDRAILRPGADGRRVRGALPGAAGVETARRRRRRPSGPLERRFSRSSTSHPHPHARTNAPPARGPADRPADRRPDVVGNVGRTVPAAGAPALPPEWRTAVDIGARGGDATAGLLSSGLRVLAVESDAELAGRLRLRFGPELRDGRFRLERHPLPYGEPYEEEVQPPPPPLAEMLKSHGFREIGFARIDAGGPPGRVEGLLRALLSRGASPPPSSPSRPGTPHRAGRRRAWSCSAPTATAPSTC